MTATANADSLDGGRAVSDKTVMSDVIVIPARRASTRFPGKPLAKIAGVTMLRRVVAIAAAAARDANAMVLVATDDEEIASEATAAGARVVMTPPELASGSDRALAAVKALSAGAATDLPRFVINLQGDAPFTPPHYIAQVLSTLRGGACDVATPVTRLSWAGLDELRRQKQAHPFSGTTCLRASDGRAFWFSKAIQPAIRAEQKMRDTGAPCPVWRHIGLYGYACGALERFAALPAGAYETLEGLEQLRFLENGMTVQTVAVEASSIAMSGIDTPQDVEWAERLIETHGDPFNPGEMGRT